MSSSAVLRLKIARSIEDIPRRDWESVFPRSIEGYDLYRTLDASSLPQFSFFYIMVYERDEPAGAAGCFLMDYPLDAAMEGGARKAADLLRKLFPRIFSPRALICGIPMGQGRVGLRGDAKGVLEMIVEGMDRIARENKAGIIGFKDFNAAYTGCLNVLLDKGFFRIESLPSTDMRLDFQDFEQYLAALSSVSRSGLRRKFRKIDGKLKIGMEVTDRLDRNALEDVFGLYMQTVERQDVGFEVLGRDFFSNISDKMPGRAKFFLWRLDGRIVAFALCLVEKGYFIDYYLGFDYSIAYELGLYFVRFRDLMNWCIENKMKIYEMGQSNYEPKRRLGFDFVRLYIYAKHRNRLLNRLLRSVAGIIGPSNFLDVFKDMEKAGPRRISIPLSAGVRHPL